MRVRPWLLVAFVVVCFFGFASQARAAWEQLPMGSPYTFSGQGVLATCYDGGAGADNCATPAYGSQDAPFTCGNNNEFACYYWDDSLWGKSFDPSSDYWPDGTLTPGVTPACNPTTSFCAQDAVDLSWMVIGVWCVAWGMRMLAFAARPPTQQ